MARNGTSGRERICITCNNPSPGPIRLLCYRWRLHGPFFPLLERLKTDENARLFVNGRVPVCNSCANYLQRQWNDYERKSISLPIEKRTYRLLSDERWEKMNHKKQLEETSRKAEETGHEMSSYDENDNITQGEKTPSYTPKEPVSRKSKIPRLAKRRADQNSGSGVNESPFTTEGNNAVEMSAQNHDTDGQHSTAVIKTAGSQTSKLVRKMAEMKFQEELDYIQRKVQKTMTMVHFKGKEERIREIEEQLKGEIGESVPQEEDEKANRMIMPLERSPKDSFGDLKEHIDQQMMLQRQEMAKFRKSIKAEIGQALRENYSRNEDLWNVIIEMNEERRSGRHQRRNRPYSDAYLKHLKALAKKRISQRDRTSDGNGEKDSDDFEYNDYH